MKKRRRLLYTMLICLLFASCEKRDFSVNSPKREEVTIVYGLLDPDASDHYIKIYKGFLTEGSAYEAAKDPHYYCYADSIEVWMEEYNGEKLVRTISFDTTTAIPKDSGLFSYPEQCLYRATAKLNLNYSYRLHIRNRYTNKIVIAETPLVGDIYITYPILNSSREITFPESDLQVKYKNKSGVSPACYEAIFTYHYTEKLKDGTQRQGKPVEWNIGNDFNNQPKMAIPYNGETFYWKVAQGIKNDPAVVSRHTDSIVLTMYKGGIDLLKYIQASTVGTGMNQEKIGYTNLHSYASEADWKAGKEDGNGIGIFSSKGVKRAVFRDLSIVSRDSLFYGRHTGHLKFTDIY
ncbi:MAG: hypothetical protein J5516_06765 [Bacteroidales bacterium]|nr:hypothetical protein [Bacteroidales bacterium]